VTSDPKSPSELLIDESKKLKITVNSAHHQYSARDARPLKFT